MSGPEDRPPRRRLLWLWLAVVAVAVVAVTVVALEYTGRPGFCENCHEMRPVVAAWRDGTHSEFDCFPCHSDLGLIGYLDAHVVDGLRDVYVHVTDPPEVVEKSYVPPRRCLVCHVDEFDDGELPDDHPARDAYCPECHRDSIHPIDGD